ncbi:MAG: hypothetical protein DMF67_18530 [Acidobacteria bacterium]|nr:MAG: hypothetical protein DMF67_18530 [Acidobacteriota bacterium]
MHSNAFLRRPFSILAAALVLCGLFFTDATAQRRRPTPPRPAADNSETSAARVSSPRDALGFTPGDDRRVADWTQITDYFKRLDRASDRVLVQQIGESTLGRPLFVAYLSAPENIRSLDRYREIQRRLADPRLVASDAARERLVREGKTVVVISCSIHSTEIVASQMSMQLAYELASAQDADTREILNNTILILIPRVCSGRSGSPKSFTTYTSRGRPARASSSRPSTTRRTRTSPRSCSERSDSSATRSPRTRRPPGSRASPPTRSTTRGGTAASAPRPTTTTQSASSPRPRARAF